ncbi:MAG: hypothetical protein RL346_1580 [Verrucomicrobiota bacterium]|jgi:uncharacterized DUF497 family protein
MEFEFDEAKSLANAEKHGIDFIEAQLLWRDERQLVIPARSETEPRCAIIAPYAGKLWTAIFTVREDRIRIISVRRSRHGEEEGYYNS